jgi:hypothetical protein
MLADSTTETAVPTVAMWDACRVQVMATLDYPSLVMDLAAA